MTKALTAIGLALAALTATAAVADDVVKNYPGWKVIVTPNRFGDASATVLAVTVDKQNSMSFRCFKGRHSVGLVIASVSGPRYTKGDVLDLKFRADDGPIIDAKALAINAELLETSKGLEIIQAAKGAKVLSFRTTDKGMVADATFKVKNPDKAIGEVLKECPANAAAPPAKVQPEPEKSKP